MNHNFCLWSGYIYKFTDIWRVLQENSSALWRSSYIIGTRLSRVLSMTFALIAPLCFPYGRICFDLKSAQLFYATKTFLKDQKFPWSEWEILCSFLCFLLPLFPHSLWRVSVRIGYQQCDSKHSLSGGRRQRPCGHGGRWGVSDHILSFIIDGKTAIFPSDISFKAVDRKEPQHTHKNEPPCVFHFRCTTGRGPERPQILGTLFSGPLRGDQPGCWLWRHRLPGGQTPVRCSVMLWMTSCPWPAVWTDPVGSHCSVCTPSAGSKNVCCRLL